jgi:hypothetical protein
MLEIGVSALFMLTLAGSLTTLGHMLAADWRRISAALEGRLVTLPETPERDDQTRDIRILS